MSEAIKNNIIDFIDCDLDEDFKVKKVNNKITIHLEGFQFNKIAKIDIKNNAIIYQENNEQINIQLKDEKEVKTYLYHILEAWVKHYGPGGDNDFKSIFT